MRIQAPPKHESFFFTQGENFGQNPQGKVSYNLSWPSGLPRMDSHHAVVRPCGQLWDVALKGSKVEPILCGVHVDMEFWEGSWIKHCTLFHAGGFFSPKSWKKIILQTILLQLNTSKIHSEYQCLTLTLLQKSPLQSANRKKKNLWHSMKYRLFK